jgi:hypothetical protein
LAGWLQAQCQALRDVCAGGAQTAVKALTASPKTPLFSLRGSATQAI